MPLIIVTGLPSSGKTHRAQQIHDYISHRLSEDAYNTKRSVSIVGSHHAIRDAPHNEAEPTSLRDEIYNSSAREKTARAEEFSAVKRGVSRDNVIIADCPNYIKGYRYQLWCEAKAASTRCCVVHVAATEEESRRWNEARLQAYDRSGEIIAQSPKKGEDMTRHGKDVTGTLIPESHTALYGDRLPDQPSRSRSSSVDATDESRPEADDTMTLKSLYISSSADQERQERTSPSNGASLQSTESYLPPQQPPAATTSPPYAPSTLTSLIMRYEPPSPFSRWDTPLFTVPTSDIHPPYSSIFDAIFPPPARPTSKKALSQLSGSARSSSSTVTSPTTRLTTSNSTQRVTLSDDLVKPHAATVLPASTSASALQLLESNTLLVVRNLLDAARAAAAVDGDGGLVSFSVSISPSTFSSTTIPATTASTSTPQTALIAEDPSPSPTVEKVQLELDIPPGVYISQPMLQRLRRKYTQLQRGRIAHGQGYVGQQGGKEGRREVVEGFTRFLEGEIGVESR